MGEQVIGVAVVDDRHLVTPASQGVRQHANVRSIAAETIRGVERRDHRKTQKKILHLPRADPSDGSRPSSIIIDQWGQQQICVP